MMRSHKYPHGPHDLFKKVSANKKKCQMGLKLVTIDTGINCTTTAAFTGILAIGEYLVYIIGCVWVVVYRNVGKF